MDWNIWDKHDLKIYFDGTYIGMREGEELKPCYVKSILDDVDGRGRGFIGSMGRKAVASTFGNPDIEIVVPESCFVNTSLQAVYLSRNTTRQYKKGIRLDQFRNEYPSRQITERLRDRADTEVYVSALLNRDYPTLAEACSELECGERVSMAFSEHFCVGLREHIPEMLLYYRGLVCGTVQDGKLILEDEFVALQEKLIEIMEAEDE